MGAEHMGAEFVVGNLPYALTEERLRDLFAADGPGVSRIAVVTDRETGRPRGFAFIEMETEEDARAAIDAPNGAAGDGRALRVDEARDRSRGGEHPPRYGAPLRSRARPPTSGYGS